MSCESCIYNGQWQAQRATISNLETRAGKAIAMAAQYGGIDGSHHKSWVIDQMMRLLCGSDYDEAIDAIRKDDNGEYAYDWDIGIAP